MQAERKLFKAVEDGDDEVAIRILEENKILYVNWKNRDNSFFTALHKACDNGNHKIVSLLLSRDGIDVNSKAGHGWTPFMTACHRRQAACILLLLEDPRVNFNEPDDWKRTPLVKLVENICLDTIRRWIASGREMDLGQPGNERNDAIMTAVNHNLAEILPLLESFRDDPEKTRFGVRMELGYFDKLAAEMLASVVFLSDGLLDLKDHDVDGAARFFSIAKRIPLELQMILCHRVVGSMGENIPAKLREAAFKALARLLV